MKVPTPRQREAIETLRRNGGAWELFLEWLRENRDSAHTDLVRADDMTHLHRLQGEARCLNTLIDSLSVKI